MAKARIYTDEERAERLKIAQKKYYEEKRSKSQKTISITLTAEQAAEDKQVIAEHGTTPSKVWRDAIEQLKAEPTNGEKV